MHRHLAHVILPIEQCAKALKTIGVREGDKVTIAMPNCPQAIYMFYAVNLVMNVKAMLPGYFLAICSTASNIEPSKYSRCIGTSPM